MIYIHSLHQAGCQTIFNQSVSEEADEEALFKSDGSFFATTMTPLRLVDDTHTLIWKNPAPCSTRFCRTIHLQFRKESDELIKKEHKRLEEEMTALEAKSLCISWILVD